MTPSRVHHYLMHDFEERPKILSQLAISSFVIAEVCVGRLIGDNLNWRRKKFKIVAYLSHLPKSDNVRFTSLDDEIQIDLILIYSHKLSNH